MNKVRTISRKLTALVMVCMLMASVMFSSVPFSLNANAADGAVITADTTKSNLITSSKTGSTTLTGRSITRTDGATLSYNYTGNIYTANSSMYDYLTDNEINGETIYSLAEGYADPYMKLNRAISNDTKSELSPASENLTIRYKSDDDNNTGIKVYMFNGANNNGWPGVDMTYDSDSGEYVYTVRYDSIGFSPNTFIITGYNDGKFWQSNNTSAALSKGKSYRFYKDNVTEGTAQNLYIQSCLYETPLYFGCFYRGGDNDDDNAGNYKASNKGDGTYKGTAGSNFYNNFYWQANMSLRDKNFDASVQGIVDNELVDGTIAQNGVKLPYFNDDWAKNHSDMVKYWHDVYFPFYEISVNMATDKVHGDSNATGYAKYYQFNSREQNLFITTNDTNHTAQYKETSTQIYSQETTTDSNGTVCYLPFNSSSNPQYNNLGFGTYFDISFKIRSDGKVDTYDADGNPTGTSVNATFEFMGDDDVWVFIDDKLVLDLGGDHKDTTGIIDFAEQKAYANDAVAFGTVNKDYIAGSISGQKSVNLKDVMAEGTFDGDEYNEDVVHTLRMFYMERGMYESDLLVRFNFSAIPNRNTLKVKEITKFTGVNAGLLDLTKQVAEDDVFQYSISNSGTTTADVSSSGILSDTYDYYQRQSNGKNTMLTGKTVEDDLTHIYLDTSWNNSWWISDGAIPALYLYGGSSTAKTILGEQVSENLYRFDTSGGYTGIDFMRVSSKCTTVFPYNGYLPSGDDGYWSRVQKGAFSNGVTYKITGFGSADTKTTVPQKTAVYEEKNFTPDNGTAVSNTNYIWTDETAVKQSGNDAIDGMTGTTSPTGTFNLMYGTDDGTSVKESSAEFRGQFAKDSTMTVNQNVTLQQPNRNNSPATFGDSARSVSVYYTTHVTVEDDISTDKVILDADTSDTTYLYQNKDENVRKKPVNITETFVNTPRVGVISVTKTLNPTDNVKDKFTFVLQLTNVFGGGINVENYENIDSNIPLTNYSDGTLTGGKFQLEGGQTLVIEGIPYGTEYKVTEIDIPNGYKQESNTNTGYEKVYEGDVTNEGLSTVSENNETVVNARLTSSLEVKKLLAGDYTEADKDKQFIFRIVLSAPENVLLGNYTPFATTPDDSDIISYNELDNSFTAKVSFNQSVKIDGLPYGTEYTVSEPSSAMPENWTSSGKVTGTIGETPSVVSITNTYTTPKTYGDLQVFKNVVTITNSKSITDEDKEKPFTFTVTLTDTADYALTGEADYQTVRYYNDEETAGTLRFVNGVATFTLKDNESLKITGIESGYHYTVTEGETDGFEQIEPKTVPTGTIKEDQIQEITFTNRKTTSDFEPYVLPAAGMEDARPVLILTFFGMMICGIAYWYVNRGKANKS